ncbi:hypothetical protein HGB07_06175 [Candidatus Roizmanbacteria bacterium]|nr:hypothetical protein [Candidatus Roizmanbacteria bacterium]
MKKVLLIIAAVLGSSFVLYLPFLLHFSNWLGISIVQSSLNYIYQNYDGLLYIVPAKTFYNPQLIQALHLETQLPDIYFAAHLPLYPLFITAFSFAFGYLKSTIIVNLVFTILLALFFYYMLIRFHLTKNPFFLVMIFLFLPRFLVVRSIGAPESLFILLILLSLFSFERSRYWLAGLFGALAVMTKLPGILLFAGYGLVFIERYIKTKKIELNGIGIFLIPLGLIGVCAWYLVQYKDFFAYFHTGGVVPMVYPFAAFNFQAKWVGTAWLEDIVFYFFLYGGALVFLKDNKYRSFFYFALVFLFAASFVQHRDISRYTLPLWPMVCIAFEKYMTDKRFLGVFILILPAIFFYAWNFIIFNVMPVGNWVPYL